MALLRKAVAAMVAALAVAGAPPSTSLAQPLDSHPLAVQLFEEAGQAQDRHAYDEACPKFAKVVELEPAKVGAKLALGDCYEQAGKLASAIDAYRAASARAAEAGDPRKTQADEKVTALEARAPRVTIEVPEALRSLPGLTILRDGSPLDGSLWNKALLSDPGEHAIYVAAPGKKPWSGKVTVTAGAVAQIVIGGLEDLPLPASLEAAPPGGDAPVPAEPSRRIPGWAWVTGGLGLASGGVAVGFAVDQAATQRSFDTGCKHQVPQGAACSGQATRLDRDFGLAIGLGSAGIAALGAAAIGITVAPRHRVPAGNEPVHASFWVDPHGSGAALSGRF